MYLKFSDDLFYMICVRNFQRLGGHIFRQAKCYDITFYFLFFKKIGC
ncbi:hypothetical protein NEIMUCOT_04130 [Neisseria mucosa ATCC 25996]|uniref:Uncharacterized protein n=1 Tax=Neisseria mucosa (strain ATCC 25996 / DSM 4631 / NCTC 10774 / M26) TaxID=546266 RepID=D2ZU42_NEIM2|nr:hypothetical protein NEIMUCOT_04130 [Neisseria mucosa ATCC 25996]